MKEHVLTHFRPSEAEAVKRLDEFARRANQNGRMLLTAFLTPRELEIAGMMAARNDVHVHFFGGYTQAERVRVVFDPFAQDDWENVADRFELACLKIVSAHRELLRHQDYLGALLGLGTQRNQIGDIVISKEPGIAFVFCVHQMALYFVEHYTHVGKVPITIEWLQRTPDLQDVERRLDEHVFTLKSLRLDALVAHAFGFSRSNAITPIQTGKVQLNFSVCTDVTAEVAVGDVISLRGEGRIRILSIDENAKSGRQFVRIGKYI